MSAFAGIVHFDGCKPDIPLIDSLAGFLARLGPDAQETCALGNAAFVHALLKTAPEPESQPLRVDENTLLVGDLRLDNRAALVRKLGLAERIDPAATPDIELLRHAWLRWGEQSPEHLEGDFSFAAWQQDRQRLFTARDRMGARTLYHARLGNRLLFSNALHALLRLPGIDRSLHPATVADYLLFRYNTDPFTTSFHSIGQLGPAHHCLFGAEEETQQRYWSLPQDDPLHFKNDGQLLEAFRERLDTAVTDRLRGRPTTVMVSGGLDSTSVAARAAKCAPGTALRLLTVEEPDLPGESEHGLAQALAGGLGLGIDVCRPGPGEGWPAPEMHWSQWNRLLGAGFRQMARNGPCGLTGQGGDPALHHDSGYFPRLFRQGRLLAFGREFLAWRRMHGRRPPLGLKAALRDRFEPEQFPGLPPWINRDFAHEQGLEYRLQSFLDDNRTRRFDGRALRPDARHQIASHYWTYVLPAHEPQVTGQPVSFAHPFFDQRLLEFLLRIPGPRWFYRKTLLRRAMADELPPVIGRRPKHVFDFRHRRGSVLSLSADDWREHRAGARSLGEYVDLPAYDRMLRHLEALPPVEADQMLMPPRLASWMSEVSAFLS